MCMCMCACMCVCTLCIDRGNQIDRKFTVQHVDHEQYFKVAECDLQISKQSSPGRVYSHSLVIIILYTGVFTSEDIQSWNTVAKENISCQPCKLKMY